MLQRNLLHIKRIQVEVYDVYKLFLTHMARTLGNVSYQYTFLWYLDFYAFVVGMWWCLLFLSLDCLVDDIESIISNITYLIRGSGEACAFAIPSLWVWVPSNQFYYSKWRGMEMMCEVAYIVKYVQLG